MNTIAVSRHKVVPMMTPTSMPIVVPSISSRTSTSSTAAAAACGLRAMIQLLEGMVDYWKRVNRVEHWSPLLITLPGFSTTMRPWETCGVTSVIRMSPLCPLEYGINLMAVYFIVHHHGGRIAATSDPGQGTTFQISMPVNCDQAPRTEENEQFLHKVLLTDQLWEKLMASE
jgi:hypothetical protein